MSLVLKNKNIHLEFHNSEEGYQGARFAQLGKLVSVKFDGILYTTNELKSGFSNQHGTGFYNEFDIDNALGYDETEKGEWFHKIGVGLLKKDDDVYDFFKEYEYVKPALEVESGQEFISFRAVQKEYNGYGYELRQTYRLKECGFSIEYSLKNTGNKTINTSEYNHNFLQINHKFIGPSYELKFLTELEMSENSKFINPENVFDFTSGKLNFNATPKSNFFISDLKAKSGKILGWEIVHNDFKISAVTDFIPSKMNVWGTEHVMSPELFAKIEVEPGRQKSWLRSYEFE